MSTLEAFKELIRSAHPYLDSFDYDHYPANFAQFEAAAEPLFQKLPEPPAEIAAQAASFVKRFAEDYAALPRREQKEISFRDKQVLALFLAPAALRAGEEAAAFARELCANWKVQFPRNPFLVGEYETIMKGFDANLLGLPLRKSKRR